MVHNWLALTVEDKLVTHDELVLAVGHSLGLFYTGNDMVGLRDTEWLQEALKVIIGLFRQYGLVTNVSKSKSMTCHLGEIRSGMSEEAVIQRCTGRG